ncbi:MAG TPA: phosphate signaling complex protein PhoU [Anaerolineae bacterium]|nr:phosphate signaling complex protein PhoU [Anaerolineae bacterium]MCB9106447.1 phosphate signaling complex protein PhoU [Anaerolineales bacterium]HRV93914.1 phosphate signaling complex protein PhoU [Anaerolineae bacterium]
MAIRHEYTRSLNRLQDEVLILGSMVEGGINDAIHVLEQRDTEGARRIIDWDNRVNEKRFAIESSALTLIATQQPAAGDLRIIAAILEIITDLERVGDYAKGIAKINLLIGEARLIKSLEEFKIMAADACQMLRDALDAFVHRDIDLAKQIAKRDDDLDEQYNQIFKALLQLIISDTRVTDQATYLLWAAHNLERTGDRVVNICERVIFMVTGQMIELNGSVEIKDMPTLQD